MIRPVEVGAHEDAEKLGGQREGGRRDAPGVLVRANASASRNDDSAPGKALVEHRLKGYTDDGRAPKDKA
jgi:hypothetical protein